MIVWPVLASAPVISWPLLPATMQTDTTVLILRVLCNGELLADSPRCRQEGVIRFDELPGAQVIGRAVEVRHIFEWAKKETQEGPR